MGVGMLTRFLGRNDTERRIMINSIAPHWDEMCIRDRVSTLEDATELVNLYRDALDAGECVVEEWRPMRCV